MGIRIKKMLGYGLVDLKHRGHNIRDRRVVADAPILTADYSPAMEVTFGLSAYVDWLDQRSEQLRNSAQASPDEPVTLGLHTVATQHAKMQLAADYSNEKHAVKDMQAIGGSCPVNSLDECVVYDGEYGSPSVLCIIPIQCYKHWRRVDNMIDYVESQYVRRQQSAADMEPRVHVSHDGFYPWIGNYWDTRTGRKIESGLACRLRREFNSHDRDYEDLSHLSELCGFGSVQDAEEFMQPIPPPGIQFLVEYSGLFKKLETIRQLLPLLYCYWS